MNDVEINSLLSSVLMQVPGCPEIVAEDAMARAIRDWYRDTHCWEEPLPKFTFFDDVASYSIIPPINSKVIALKGVCTDGKPVGSNHFVLETPRRLTFLSKLKTGIEITPVVILSTDDSSRVVRGDHSSQWLDNWMHGTLWYLQMQAAQPWYNPEESERNRMLFRSAIVNQRVRLNTSNRTGDLTVRPRRFI